MSRTSSRASMGSSRSSPTPLKRLTHEINTLRSQPPDSVLHLGPSSDTDLFTWEAVLKGPRDQRSPYAGGLWLLNIKIPPNYPLSPPTVRFETPCCHPNIHWTTGEVCLSLLDGSQWSPAYTLGAVMGALQQLLVDPGLDSPLNVDIANLLREDDAVGWEGLVRFWTAEKRWAGEGMAGFISTDARGSVGVGGPMSISAS